MRLFYLVTILFLVTSCSKINFLLDKQSDSNFLKNKTLLEVDGSENAILKEVLFFELGQTHEKRFLLTVVANETQTKRSVSENQVAQKIDYKITINYSLRDIQKKCLDIEKTITSSFSFTPKSSGYNFASDVLLKNLYEEALSSNLESFIFFVDNKLEAYKCLNEN